MRVRRPAAATNGSAASTISLALYQDQVPVRHDRREKLREFLDGRD